MTTMTRTIDSDVTTILRNGGNPAAFRRGIAADHGVDPTIVDAAIVAAVARLGDAPQSIHPEDVAQRRIADDRKAAQQDRAGWREFNHEEA